MKHIKLKCVSIQISIQNVLKAYLLFNKTMKVGKSRLTR